MKVKFEGGNSNEIRTFENVREAIRTLGDFLVYEPPCDLPISNFII